MKTYKSIIQSSLLICFVSLIFVPDVSWGVLPSGAQIYVKINGSTFEAAKYADNIQSNPAKQGASWAAPELKLIGITKALDNLSPILRKYAILGQILPTVVIQFKEPSANQPVYEVTLKDAIIQEVSVEAVGSGTNETVLFALPNAVCWTYYETGVSTQACWDLKKNTVTP